MNARWHNRLIQSFGLAAAFVLIAPGVSSRKAAVQENQAASAEKLRRAEATVERFVRLFNETLDFSVPYRELHIPEPHWQGEAQVKLSRRQRQADEAEEQMMFATMNLWYLRAAYFFGVGASELPPEIRAARGYEAFPYLKDLDYTNRKPLSIQLRKRQQYLANTKRLADLYRRYLPPSVFASTAYRARVEEADRAIAGNRPRSRIERGSAGYPELQNRDVYLVLYAGFQYTLIEEQGEFKVIHINPLPGFRMSP